MHSIPLESGASSDCTLTEFAVRADSVTAAVNNSVDRINLDRLPEPNEVLEVGDSPSSGEKLTGAV